MKKYLLTVLALCLFIGQACQKDDPAPEPEPTMAELLIGEWHLNEQIVDGTSETITDCMKNTTFEFDAERNFVLDNYSLSSGDDCVVEKTTGTYILDEETKQLIFQGSDDGDLASINIISITANELTLSSTISDFVQVFNKN